MSECFEGTIERPSGISGYRPSSWCSVCGRTVALAEVKQCTREGCTNVCHLHCLGEETHIRCGNTGQLRALLGIPDPVTPYTSSTQVPPDPQASADSDEEEPEDDLCDLRKEELIRLVRNLRKDLLTSNSQLSSYRYATEDLVAKRRLLTSGSYIGR